MISAQSNTTDSQQRSFTAWQIARAARLTRQAISQGLQGITPRETVNVSGTAAGAWSWSDLLLEWQMAITRRGVKRGFENGERFLESLRQTPWKSPLPWGLVRQREQEKAVKLQKAMARALELRASAGVAARQAEEMGLQDFQAQFGYSISARQWRRLLSRTIDRDGGEENWQRLEIYLDDRAFVKAAPRREVLQSQYQHRELDEVFATLQNRQNPTAEDRPFLWDAVLAHYERNTDGLTDSPASNRTRRMFKASLVSYLFKAFPEHTLCATEASLKRRFDEKLILWRNGGRSPGALQDKRALNSGNFSNQEYTEDLKKIRNLAIQLDGNEALAHRMLRERGELSEEFCKRYAFNPREDKSALPKAVRDSISAEVNMCLPLRRGPWQARMTGPHIPRDWSGVMPGDWFCADDVTWNHYFKIQAPGGQWEVLRGECLLMTDLRTGYPLDFLLIPGKYNGEHVRSLALRVHDRVGLPRCGFYFEKGVWASRLITGDNRQGTPVHWREAENGLCSAGLKLEIKHATTPRAKPIEGLLGIIQERMRCIFGFVGFNEREYDAERIQAMIARARRGDASALSQFPTIREWADKIAAVLQDFAHDPQNSKMLDGATPAEMWRDEVAKHPLRVLPMNARYVLSTHQKRVTVRQEGIVIKIRGREHVYFSGETGPLIGKEVLAFYNIEMPELLTVSDLSRQKYFTVHEVVLPAMSATREQIAEVNALRKAHMSHAKAVFGEIRHEVVSQVCRDNEFSEGEKALGEFHNNEMKACKAESAKTAQSVNKARRKAIAAGFDPNRLRMRNPEAVAAAASRIADRFAQLREKEAQQEEAGL